jgi:multidrug resistance efflux pump
MIRRVLVGLGAFAGVAGLCLVVGRVNGESAPAAASATVQVAARGWIDVEGGVLTIRTLVDGTVSAVHVQEGEHVKRGQVLMTLNDVPQRTQLRITDAEVAQATAQGNGLRARLPLLISRAAHLHDAAQEGAAPGDAADEAAITVEVARTELHANEANVQLLTQRRRLAAAQLEATQIRAPTAGQIVRRGVSAGDVVTVGSGATLFQLLPDGPQIVRAEVDEELVDQLKVGVMASVTSEADTKLHRTARLLRIASVQGQSAMSDAPGDRFDKRSVECVLQLDGPPLRIGQRVIVRFGP